MDKYKIEVSECGTMYWSFDGRVHRVGSPAIKFFSGNEWYLNGNLHREDGPAVEWCDGYKEWWLNGHELSEKQYRDRVSQG